MAGNKKVIEEEFTRYEKARILGARSLQLAMDAPILLKMTADEEEALNYDVLKIAEKEFEAHVLPITVRRPLPKRSEKHIKKLSDEEIKEKLEEQTKKELEEVDKIEGKKEEIEELEEKEIKEEGEIMEMAKPDDEENLSEETEGEEV
ncbi:DNA-directed RNA polymerase subunit K [Candidatus Pacearchaeota archaeon]|nr:DNA-directed RNA polymerase subunit K [Candidatus Pacearchaeota archaeon]